MVIIGHGSELALAPTVKPLVQQTGQPIRDALDQVLSLGFRHLQLDATLSGIRPRELGPRARRDLIAMLMRRGVTLAGLDFFPPRKHFLDAAKVDQVVAAAIEAIGLAGELGRVPMSLALPVRDVGNDIRQALLAAADSRGVALAVHAEDQLDELLDWVGRAALPHLGGAIDPAALLASGKDPVGVVTQLGNGLRVARLSDLASSDGGGGIGIAGVRCAPGQGDLELTEYRVAIDMAAGRRGAVVLDLRGLEFPLKAAVSAQQAWEDAAFTLPG